MLIEVICQQCEQGLKHVLEDGILYILPCKRCEEELEEILIDEIKDGMYNDYDEGY